MTADTSRDGRRDSTQPGTRGAPARRRIPVASGIACSALEWGADTSGDHTVVLVHGFLDMAWSWRRVVDAGLAGQFHVVAPDMRGHGDSDRVGPGGYYYFFDYLADLHDVIAALRRDRVSLVGHSMGGSVCAYYAGAFPDRVWRLALLEGLGPPEHAGTAPERIGPWIDGMARARRRSPRTYPDVAAAAAQILVHDPLCDPELARELAEHGTAPAGGGVRFKHDPLHLTWGPLPFRIEAAAEFWRRIRCPVLLVEGAESRFASREDTDRRAAELSSAARVDRAVLDGAAHMMHRHQPRALARRLIEHLA